MPKTSDPFRLNLGLLAVLSAVALLSGCATNSGSNLGTNAEFRALADQAVAIMNSASKTHETVHAENFSQTSSGIPHQWTMHRTEKLWTESEITTGGLLKVTYHQEANALRHTISNQLEFLKGDSKEHDEYIVAFSVPIAALDDAYVLEEKTRSGRYSTTYGEATATEELTKPGYLVVVRVPSAKHAALKGFSQHIVYGNKVYKYKKYPLTGSVVTCSAFNDKASADRLTELLNKLINLTKGNTRD